MKTIHVAGDFGVGLSIALIIVAIGGCEYLCDSGKAKVLREQNMPKTWASISNILTRAKP